MVDPSAALPDGVEPMIGPHLLRQRWYGGSDREAVPIEVVATAELSARGGHRLLWAIVADGGGRYQLVLGERRAGEHAEFLNGQDAAFVGATAEHFYYDAMVDPELSIEILGLVTGGREHADRVRPITAEQSNSSLVYDDRIILKLFRRLSGGANPDVEVTEALAAAGFAHVAAPVATWCRDDDVLAFAQRFLAGGSEGWALALTSLRDLYAAGPDDPSEAGGDFSSEASRLGRATAEMHLALASAFGVDREVLRAGAWDELVAEIESGLHRAAGAGWTGTPAHTIAALRAAADPGPAIRVHGDYHLGQVMRTDAGWFVLDFEGEPARPLHERIAPTSPFKDVAAMLRSFQYAAHFALLERGEESSGRLQRLADAWERRNRAAFLEGYLATVGITALLPEDGASRAAVSLAFELDKALYELAYERAYRPEWVDIPSAAIRRLLARSESDGLG